MKKEVDRGEENKRISFFSKRTLTSQQEGQTQWTTKTFSTSIPKKKEKGANLKEKRGKNLYTKG